jgi:hypothetical protein
VAGRKFPAGQAHVIALVTGDGNNNKGRASFPDHIETALLNGLWVELYAWAGSLSSVYGKFEDEYGAGGRFKIIKLDGHGI